MNDSDNDNGSPVTAEDVAYVIDIAEDLNAQTRAAGLGEIIEISVRRPAHQAGHGDPRVAGIRNR